MSDEQFYRMRRLPPYVIAEVNAMRHAARAAGRDIIDLGMGNPVDPTPEPIAVAPGKGACGAWPGEGT